MRRSRGSVAAQRSPKPGDQRAGRLFTCPRAGLHNYVDTKKHRPATTRQQQQYTKERIAHVCVYVCGQRCPSKLRNCVTAHLYNCVVYAIIFERFFFCPSTTDEAIGSPAVRPSHLVSSSRRRRRRIHTACSSRCHHPSPGAEGTVLRQGDLYLFCLFCFNALLQSSLPTATQSIALGA